jgi:hypothetical protein
MQSSQGGREGSAAVDAAVNQTGERLSSRPAYRLGLLGLGLLFLGGMLGAVLLGPTRAEVAVSHGGSWDALSVKAGLRKRSVFGEEEVLPARLMQVTVRDAQGTVLYQGDSPAPSIADAARGNGEALSVEACVKADASNEVFCATDQIAASPKRESLAAGGELRWPISSVDPERGEARFEMRREREVFGQTGQWEDAGAGGTGKVRLIAALEGGPPGSEVVLDVLADGSRHGFTLAHGQGYAGFKTALEQAVAGGGKARVNFRLEQLGAAGQGVVLGAITKVFQRKTQAERDAEVQRCVQLIAEKVTNDGYGGGNSIRGGVRGSWKFDDASGRYFVDMDIGFDGSNTGIPYKLSGRAEFNDGGSGAKFDLVSEDIATQAILKRGSGLIGMTLGWRGNQIGDLSCAQ